MKIFIDPGHGGIDSGATYKGLIEKEMNLVTSLALGEYLQQYGIDVKYSRTTDIYLSLTHRAGLANEWGADYFISVHYNAGGGDRGEVIHSVYAGKGQVLAMHISDEMKAIGQSVIRVYSRPSTKNANLNYYTVIQDTKMPAIITEGCFIDNDLDRQIADTPEKQKAMGVAIAKGILSFLGIEYTDTASPYSNPSIVDCTNELLWRGIITDQKFWNKKAESDEDIKWLFIKYYPYIMENGGSVKHRNLSSDEAIFVLQRCGVITDYEKWNEKAWIGKDDVYWLLINMADYVL